MVAEGLKVLEAVTATAGPKVTSTEYDLGARRWHATGETLPESVLTELGQHDAILLGAIAASLAEGAELPIRGAHLVDALAEVKPTTGEWLTTARNYARYANEGGQYDEVLAFLARHGKR